MTDKLNDIARMIYQSILDGMGDAVRLRDFNRYVPFFAFPNSIETFSGTTILFDEDALRVFFGRLTARLQELRVESLTRECTIAEFDDADTISGYHETRVIDVDGVLHEAYVSLTTLRRIEGQWLLVAAQYAASDTDLPGLLVSVPEHGSKMPPPAPSGHSDVGDPGP